MTVSQRKGSEQVRRSLLCEVQREKSFEGPESVDGFLM